MIKENTQMIWERLRPYHGRERMFEKRCDLKWFLLIIASFLCVVLSLSFCRSFLKLAFVSWMNFWGKSTDDILRIMREEGSFLGNSVWTLTTILAAFMVLHYSSQGNSIYGIQNRKIIAYTIGSYFIPGLVFFNIAIVLRMTCAYYMRSFMSFYILALYSVFLQLLLIICSIKSTSRHQSFQVILKIERRQFKELCRKKREEKNSFPISKENVIIYHVESILKGKETLTEKFEIIQEILYIPFYEKYQDSTFFVHGFYYYVYHNIYLVTVYVEDHLEERQKLYDTIYENVKCFWKQYTKYVKSQDTEQQKDFKNKILLYMAALFHAVITKKKISERWEFFSHIIVGIFSDEEFRRVVFFELLMSLYDLWRRELIDFEEESEHIEKFCELLLIKKMQNPVKLMYKDLEEIKNELQMVVLSWNMGTTIEKELQYETAEEILECLENNDGENYIYYLLRQLEEKY